ncbi:MAG: type II secretion system minor pseudopilin GspK [Sedimentisphaerales bacterium]|nr:type II secretion system minor pseudopilin GspK [Sedimentisphaerales bacterium]
MRPSAANHRRSGFVLVLVLGMVILMSGLLFGFSHKTRASLAAADGFRQSEQALNCARAGLQLAISVIRDTNDLGADPRLDKLRNGKAEFAVGAGACTLKITEEGGRLNVNTLKDKHGRIDRKRVDQFLKLIDLLNRQQPQDQRIGYGLAPAIIDWTDADDQVTYLPFIKVENSGAESSYYGGLNPPYPCMNGPIDVLDELLQVRGMTPQFLGRLREFLTTTGDGRININAAPQLVIECLAEPMDATLAQMIVQQRRLKPFKNVTELRDVPGMTDNVFAAIQDSVAVGAGERYYRVRAQGNVADRHCRVEAVLRKNPQAANVDVILYRES